MLSLQLAFALAVALVAPLPQNTGAATVLFSSVAASPTSDVPGFPGLKFSGTAAAFDRPFGSKNGHWILRCDTDALSTADTLLLHDGLVVAREGDAAPGTSSELFSSFQLRCGVNESGQVAFKVSTNGPAIANDYVYAGMPGGVIVVAQEGDLIPGFVGSTYDDLLTGVNLLNSGEVYLEADGIDGGAVTTADDEVFLSTASGQIVARESVTIPAGQFTGLSEAVEDIDFEDVWVTPDGMHYVFKGNLTGATTSDNVVIHDGTVVLQEGFVIPGSGFADAIDTSGIVEVALDLSGAWWARGNNDSEDDWVVRDGVVMARVGDPIFVGATELWDDAALADCFFMHQGDSLGNYVVAGVTDAADSFANAVLVLNGQTVVCREGDPVDLDGNGLFDDGYFLNAFGNDDVVLNDLGELYFVATLRTSNATTTSAAQALFRVDLGAGGVTSYCTAGTSNNGCVATVQGTGLPSVSSATFILTTTNLEGQRLALHFYGVTGRSAIPFPPGGTSFLCVNAPTQRMAPGLSSGTAGLCDGQFSSDWWAYVFANPGAHGAPYVTGMLVQAQAWYRDAAAPGGTNLSNALEFTLLP